jgi:hypothetical protein
MEHVVYLVPQVVTERVSDTLTATLLKPSLGSEVGFAEPTNGLALVGPQFGTGRRTVVVAVTHRDE